MGELIPKIYDAARTIKILGPDEAQKIVKINQMHTDETGKDRHYDLAGTKGSWVVTMGKSYSSKRMEAFDNMQTVIQANPDLMNVIGDIMFRNYDGAGAEEMADRLHKMLPPQLQDDQNELPPQAQAAVAQAQQQSQMIQGEMQKLQFEKAAKVAEHQGKMQQIALQHQADMALEQQKLEAQITVAEISTKAQSQTERDALVPTSGSSSTLRRTIARWPHRTMRIRSRWPHSRPRISRMPRRSKRMQRAHRAHRKPCNSNRSKRRNRPKRSEAHSLPKGTSLTVPSGSIMRIVSESQPSGHAALLSINISTRATTLLDSQSYAFV
jgi:hypothetical protein